MSRRSRWARIRPVPRCLKCGGPVNRGYLLCRPCERAQNRQTGSAARAV